MKQKPQGAPREELVLTRATLPPVPLQAVVKVEGGVTPARLEDSCRVTQCDAHAGEWHSRLARRAGALHTQPRGFAFFAAACLDGVMTGLEDRAD